MTTTCLVLVAGGLLGAGLVVVVAGLSPARPDLADAVDRLLPTQAPTWPSATSYSRFDARRQELLARSARTLGLARYASALRMVEVTPETLAARKLTYAAVGVAFPAVMSALMALGHVRLPIGVPAAAGLVLGAIFFLLPDLNLRQEATAARARMRTATCVWAVMR
jgi:hypothetical protein